MSSRRVSYYYARASFCMLSRSISGLFERLTSPKARCCLTPLSKATCVLCVLCSRGVRALLRTRVRAFAFCIWEGWMVLASVGGTGARGRAAAAVYGRRRVCG
jgi:hypothetical protein